MTVAPVEPLTRTRRTGVDFIGEAIRAAAVARSLAHAANAVADEHEEAAAGMTSRAARHQLRAARRLRQEAATHERDAQCHEDAVMVVVSLALVL